MVLRDRGNQAVGIVSKIVEGGHGRKGYFLGALLRRHWTFLLAILPLLGWWTYGLFDLDEGFYAAIASEMNRRGEWITTFYNGKPWFEKPILTYWALKPALMLFGETVGPRVPSVLATIGLYAICAAFARRRMSETAARWVALILGSSLLVVGIGRMILTDPLLDFCLTGAFLAFYESLAGDRRWRIAAAALLGLGALAKGPVVGALFIPVAAWSYWKSPALRPAFRGYWLMGCLAFGVVVATWYLPAYLQYRETFVQKFLVEQNLGRFSGGDAAHNVPFLRGGFAFYLLVILVGFAPWSFRLPVAWKANDDLARYLKAWALTILIFFTISTAKLVHYVLPAIPPLALLVAASIPQAPRFRPSLIRAGIVFAIANVGFLVYYYGLSLGSLRVPGFHAEVHRLARYVRAHAVPGDEVAVYSLPKSEAFPGKPGVRLQETSHPSLLLYLDRDVLETKDWSKVLAETKPTWIITRWNRIGPEEFASAQGRLREVPVRGEEMYRLYRLAVPSS